MGEVLIKCFETPKKKYFYDRVFDTICTVTDTEYAILKKVEKESKLPIDNSLQRFTNNGLLQESVVENIEHPESVNLKYLSENCMGNLILQVTQQCNLRCKYCAYSGNYYNRTHSSERMSFEDAKRVIDFYLERSIEMDELALSFYGGEPLLEFDLIKRCVDYIISKSGERKVRFPMTTNGTLLTEEVIKFLVQHEFKLLISLDGNKESHDINRQFRNGGGSFEVIYNNFMWLRLYVFLLCCYLAVAV